jgi:hypothetical protein
MASQYRDDGSARGQRPATLRKFAAAVFAVVCMVGPAMAWDWDAASVRIVAPVGNVDSGTTVTPSAVVLNLGDSIASFPVLLIIGSSYADTEDVVGLNPGDSVAVSFLDWTAEQRGMTIAVCSTALSADESTANDRFIDTFTVRIRDVGADQVVAPVGIINYGLTVTPQAAVTNYGTNNVNRFDAIFRIGASYTDTATIRNLGPGASRVVNFADWTADSLGTFAVSCTTAYTNDVYPENNLAQDSCTVQIVPEDAGVMRVVAPRGLVDSGAVLAPQAMVRNFGTDTISFPAIFKVGTYVDTQQVTNLASFDSLLVTFDNWTAEPVGWLTTRCSTALADDSNATNNARSDSVHVIIRTTDVGAVRFTAPPDTVDSGATVPVKAWVRNFGLAMQSFPVRVRLGSLYSDTVQVDSLAAGDSLEVTFADYPVAVRGPQTVRCSTMLAGDQDVSNNLVWKWVFRRVRDVGALSITAPTGVVPEDTVVIPSATVRRFGNTTDSFPVIFRIGTFYEDTAHTNDTLALVTFRPCTLSVSGTFSVMCSTAKYLDVIPANDAVYDSVQVTDVGISATDAPGIPRTVTLRGNGPFAGRVAIEYGLPKSVSIRLEVYDATGRLVQVVASGASQAGYHTAVWKCTDRHGKAVAEGAYFVRLVADGVTLTSKVVKTE